ncbi:MAG: rod-binding protein [Deltaproteobacteria bacterium]|nr:rod-binding protein [Deltaproteobacteria bacterium]
MPNTITETHSKPPVASAQTAMKDAKLKKACADFESIFIHYILKSARKSLPQNGLFDNTQGQKVYKSMADQAMSENIAGGRGMGLGKLLYNQLK